MAFKKPKINKINADISNLSVFLIGQVKAGKSTLFRNIILEKYGDPTRGLLISVGSEGADTMLDEVNSTTVDSWGEFVELVDWLIETKGKEHNIEIVSIDTIDELVKLAEQQALVVSYKESREAGRPMKVKSLNSAFGGYSRGYAYVANDLLTPTLGKIKKHFGLFVVGHTKFKTITRGVDSVDNDIAIQQLTSSLDNRYNEAISGILDSKITIAIENPEKIGETTVGIKSAERTVKLVDATKQVRRIYFRPTSQIDAGGRFADFAEMPESMVYELDQNNAKKFIEIVELGMEKSKLKYRHNNGISQPMKAETETIETIKEDLSIPAEDDLPVEEVEWAEPSKDEILQMVIDRFKACKDKEVKTQVREISGGAINKETNIEVLKQILEILE